MRAVARHRMQQFERTRGTEPGGAQRAASLYSTQGTRCPPCSHIIQIDNVVALTRLQRARIRIRYICLAVKHKTRTAKRGRKHRQRVLVKARWSRYHTCARPAHTTLRSERAAQGIRARGSYVSPLWRCRAITPQWPMEARPPPPGAKRSQRRVRAGTGTGPMQRNAQRTSPF